MKRIETNLPGVFVVEPQSFFDERGSFFESYNQTKYSSIGIPNLFIQDNESFSYKNVIRGLHLQLPPFSQGKLVRVVMGEVLDVAVDCRFDSPTFGQHVEVLLSGENKLQLWVPQGFAHGFAALSSEVIFDYKCDNPYSREHELSILYNDPDLNIHWRIEAPIVAQKDLGNQPFADVKSQLEKVRFAISPNP